MPEQQFTLTIAAPDTTGGFACYHWSTTDLYAIDTLGQSQPQVWDPYDKCVKFRYPTLLLTVPAFYIIACISGSESVLFSSLLFI